MKPECGFLTSEQLDAAVDGKLDEQRLAEFEEHIEGGCVECVTLAADLQLFRSVAAEGTLETERQEDDRQAEFLRERLRREVKQASPTADRGSDEATVAGSVGGWQRLAAAAAVMFVIVAGWFALRDRGTPGSLHVSLPDGGSYIAQVRTFSAPPVLRGEPNLEQLWREAEVAYNDGDYERAEQRLAAIVEQREDSFDARVYRGVALLALDRVDPARAEFALARAVAVEQDFSTGNLAWFEGLAALADGDLAAATTALEEAAQHSPAHGAQARELLDRVR